MKNILGFSIGEASPTEPIIDTQKEDICPVRSLVLVRFINDGREFTYYNDKFDLKVGDYVFVSGKLAGKLGSVEKITTRFKINLADYQRVISKANGIIHGTFEAVFDKMVSYDRNAFSPEEFRSWILPPAHWDGDGSEDKENQVIVGEGYEFSLSAPEDCIDVTESVLERAFDYCEHGKVAYISVRSGVGTAYVEGSKWYEVNFELHGGLISEMFCDCPYPGLCKHMLAVALTLCAMVKFGGFNASSDFVAIDKPRFWDMVARNTKRVTL